MDEGRCLGLLGVLAWCVCLVSSTILIQDIVGPESVELGSTDEVVLDCDFETTPDEKEVVVKWFYNGTEEQIYQWISSLNHPSIIGRFREYIDPTYKASDNRTTMYRALKLHNINPMLSGNYTCKVSSDTSEHVKTQQFIIYSPPESFESIFIEGDELIICNAHSVSPQPTLDIRIIGNNSTFIDMPESFDYNKTEVVDDEGFYNTSATLSFNSTYLPQESIKFVCELSIPGTNYSTSRTIHYFNEAEYLDEIENYVDSTESPQDLYTSTEANAACRHLSSNFVPLFFLIFLSFSIIK